MKGTDFRQALMVCTVLACPAVFAQPVTYSFVGSVTGDSGSFSAIPMGTTVTGTYTFDVDAGSSSGTAGVSGWSVGAEGGSYYGTTASPALVFSSTAQLLNSSKVVLGSYNTASNPAGTYTTESLINNEGSSLTAYEYAYPASFSVYTTSQLNLYGNGIANAFLNNGLPNPAGFASFSYGEDCTAGCANEFEYSITSLTQVPLPPTYVLMLSGMVAMAGLNWRRRKGELRT